MMPISNWPIRSQIALMLAAITLPLAVLAALGIWKAASDRWEAEAGHLAVLARAAASETAGFLRSTEELLARLSARPGVAAMGRLGCDPVFETFTQQNLDYTNLVLADAEGRVICSAISFNIGKAVRLTPAAMKAANQARDEGKLAVSQPAIGFTSGRWAFAAAYPVKDAAGRYHGTIGVGVDLVRMQPLGQRSDIKMAAGNVMLVNAAGLVLAGGGGKNLHAGMRLNEAVAGELPAAGESNWRLAGTGDLERLYARVPVEGTLWYAVAATDYAPLRAAIWRDVTMFGGLAALVVLTGC